MYLLITLNKPYKHVSSANTFPQVSTQNTLKAKQLGEDNKSVIIIPYVAGLNVHVSFPNNMNKKLLCGNHLLYTARAILIWFLGINYSLTPSVGAATLRLLGPPACHRFCPSCQHMVKFSLTSVCWWTRLDSDCRLDSNMSSGLREE